MKGINLPWTDGRDVYYPMDKSHPAHVERLRDFSKVNPELWHRNCATKDATHMMSELFGPKPQYKTLGKALIKLSDHVGPNF